MTYTIIMTREEFIFNKKFPQRLYRHLIFWLLYYLFSLVTYFHPYLEKTSFGKWLLIEAIEVLCHLLTQMAFCYAVLYLLLPAFLNRKKYISFAASVTVLAIIIYFIYYLEHITIFKGIHTYAGFPFMPPHLLYWFLLISFLSYFPISAGLVIAIRILKNFYLKQKENQLLTRENANAELQLLKAQIHPHFLFNTLNNIYSFTLSKSSEAPALVEKLSDTIHYMITDCKTDAVPLQKELKMLEDYIGLEKVRYGERLELSIDITNEYQNKSIAPLLMIPFVENCFKHGTSMVLGKQWIKLSIQLKDDVLYFTCSNSKPLQPAINKNKNGIGLSNVKKRLALLYPGKHQLHMSTAGDVYTVQMQIALQTQAVAEK